MVRALFALIAVAAVQSATAAPFVKSQPYPAAMNPKPTACLITVDGAAAVNSPVLVDGTGPRCSYDVGAIAVGAHIVTSVFTVTDPIWGQVNSGVSNTLNFTRPSQLQNPVIELSLDP